MSDRELLERAAMAAGGYITYLSPDGYPWMGLVVDGVRQPYPVRWNPLVDGGDALRLLVVLPGCSLYVSEMGATVFLPHEQGAIRLKCDEYANEHGGDLNAATRRAIVRAAAEFKP